ncbi:MAG TPA: tetratricopeptide repeat protein [Luteolibacter sp.]|nr:tetratricopeptide repeat protein [Luteolibacter sp.]
MMLRKTLTLVLASAIAPLLPAAVSLATENTATLPTDTEGPAKPALDAFRAGRHAKAVELAQPLAGEGNADALYLMGYAHETGQGAEASRDKALEFYRKAAAAKHLDASYRMSFILLASEDEKEREQARESLESAARNDVTVAGRILGEAYLLGRLSPSPDPDKAVFWWQRAADAGDIPSMLLLARFYDGQFGFPELREVKKALDFFAKAAGLGNAGAMAALGSRLLNGEKEIRDEKRAREWLKKAIDAKEYSAWLALGDYEENVNQDLKAAFAHYERGKDAGQIDCMLRAAAFHMEGKGTEKDVARGLDILNQAAKAGSPVAHFQLAAHKLSAKEPDLLGGYAHLVVAANSNLVEAQNELGLLYLSDRLQTADPTAGVAWLTRAARNGHAAAQNNLATLYENGLAGLGRNPENAGQLYSLAANQGHAAATLALARMHRDGTGTEADPVKAWALASLAEERGAEDAAEMVKSIGNKLTEEQRVAAAKTLADLKSGKAPAAEEATGE